MVMSKVEWDKLQKKLPKEDRMSYADYLAAQGASSPPPSKAASGESGTIQATSIANQVQQMQDEAIAEAKSTPMDTTSQRYTQAAINAGLTPSPNTSAAAASSTPAPSDGAGNDNAGSGNNNAGGGQQLPAGFTAGKYPAEFNKFFGPAGDDVLGYKLTSYTDKAGKTFYRLSVSRKGAYGAGVTGSEEYGAAIVKGAGGAWESFSFSDGGGTGGSGAGTGSTGSTGQTGTLEALLAQQAADAKAAADAAKRERAENAIAVLTARFSQYGLQSLVPKIKDLAIGGATEATITLQLQETEEYRQRFRANQDRIKKGLSVLDPGDYLNLEDKYRQILRAYGLRQFDTDDYVTQFISNDVSSAELSSRVQLAVQRVQNADPAVLNTLTKYYGIGTTDLVAYALDPDTQFQKIERQVAAAEIGAAAALQGIQPGVAVAEQLAAQGVTQAEAQKGYATIADILPGATKLSQIYGGVLEGYGLAEAEQEVFNSLASAQRKRRGLLEREAAAFAGTSGLGRTSLSTQLGGTF